MKSPHIPVLKEEILDTFSKIKDGIIVDCTLGYAGHSKALLEANLSIKIVGVDKDKEAIEFSSKFLEPFKDRVEIIHAPFSKALEKIDSSKIRGLLADIGVSSLQLDKNSRGFSLNSLELDMRMDKNSALTAFKVVNSYSQSELERVFLNYGEIKSYKNIAKKIVLAREEKEISSAVELANIIGKRSERKGGISTATLAFQAIRIEVNDELKELETLLDEIERLKLKDCTIAIISFHSLEDKIVKQRFKKWQSSCICPPFLIKCECGNNHSFGKILTKKPIVATNEELSKNSRASSAKLRIFKTKG